MPHTINLCRECYDHRLIESGESKVSSAVWHDLIRQETSRGGFWAAFGSDGFVKSVWERFTVKKKKGARNLLEEAANRQQLAK